MLRQENYENILIDKQDGVAILTMNRPERLNAVNGALHSELSQVFDDAHRDNDVRAVVLTGAGRAFCAGGDFSPGRSFQTKSGLSMWQEARRIVDSIFDLEKPVIAAVNGHAVGLGATLALSCDVAIAARSAKIGDPHVKMGITAGDGGAVIFPLLVGVNRAKYMLMTGDLLPAEEAERWGLVFKVVDDGQALDEALVLARRLAAGAPMAVQSSKASVNRFIKMVSNLVLPYSLAIEGMTMQTEDHREAVAAFQEKREPKFSGR
jgi:enoyl-CoA hydratase